MFKPKEGTMKASQAAFATATFAFFSLVAPVAWAQGHSEHVMVGPKDLTWADVPSLPAGAKIAVIEGPMNEAKPFTVRLKFPANYKIPAHSHPAIEHVTVISGTFNMGTGDKLDPKQTKALSAGSVAIVQPKINHFGWTKRETIVQLHGVGPWGVTYVNPSDDPRKK
ncbi:MAG TPA: cupin domain-containing protein [Burkholderiales bacterium]|nr:cupin domain-containing protein [Burkholderiales bacterium]